MVGESRRVLEKFREGSSPAEGGRVVRRLRDRTVSTFVGGGKKGNEDRGLVKKEIHWIEQK